MKGEKTMNSKHGVLDIPRESNQRQRRIRMIIYSVVGVAVVAGITVFLSRLKPAAPVVDKTAVWIDTVKKGPMVIGVEALGIVAPQTKGAKAPSNSTTVRLRIPQAQAKDVRDRRGGDYRHAQRDCSRSRGGCSAHRDRGGHDGRRETGWPGA